MKRLRMKAPMLGAAGFLAATLAVAEDQMMNPTIIGQVVSANSAKHELTIREEGSNRTRIFKVLNPDVMGVVHDGDRVQVTTADQQTAESVSKY